LIDAPFSGIAYSISFASRGLGGMYIDDLALQTNDLAVAESPSGRLLPAGLLGLLSIGMFYRRKPEIGGASQ
jgi:hypothetical protein